MEAVLLAGIVGLAAALAGWLWRARLAETERKTAAAAAIAAQDALTAAQIAAAEATAQVKAGEADRAELVAARARITALSGEIEALKAERAAAEKAHGEQVAALTALRQDVQDRFKLLAGDVVKAGTDDFLKRSGELFALQKAGTAAEIDKRSQAIAETVKPLSEKLAAYEALVREIEKARLDQYGQLSATLAAVSAQTGDVKTVTANLVNALRAAPKTRGRWGEETLRRVAELSGMSAHCDFDLEFPLMDEGLRPDMIVRVAGGRAIVVDAKAPLSAYLDALEATDETERKNLMTLHARQMRERMTNLASKAYWAHFHGSADTVVMFVPGDNFVSAAFENDPDLFEDGMKSRVLICTPTTFIALMKAISYGWGQETLAQSAAEIGKLGKDLYARLATLGGLVAKVGGNLETTVKNYNALVASLESRVMPQARKFNELGVEGTSEPLSELNEIDTTARLPQPGRDLLLQTPDQP